MCFILLFAALPTDHGRQVPQESKCVHVGDIVSLPCDYQPGALVELYSVQWIRSGVDADGTKFSQTISLESVQNGTVHLSIDPETFSLNVLIEQLDQDEDKYWCVVVVRPDNITSNTRMFEGRFTVLRVTGMAVIVIGDPIE